MNGHTWRRNGHLVSSGRTFRAKHSERTAAETMFHFRYKREGGLRYNEDGYRGARTSAAPGRCLLPTSPPFSSLRKVASTGIAIFPVGRDSSRLVIARFRARVCFRANRVRVTRGRVLIQPHTHPPVFIYDNN